MEWEVRLISCSEGRAERELDHEPLHRRRVGQDAAVCERGMIVHAGDYYTLVEALRREIGKIVVDVPLSDRVNDH